MGITPFDDFPIHQVPLPVAHTASSHPNAYDRYWFNGYDRGEGFYFGVAMGLYPNRRVIDAAFSVVRDGEQRSVFASGRAPRDRGETRVGPIRIEVVEPLGRNRVSVEAAEQGISASLEWRPRTAAVAEPRQTLADGHVAFLDATRLVQWGSWEGRIDVEGDTVTVSGDASRGTKDRSWGIRPVGEPMTGAPGDRAPGVFFLWAPVHFAAGCSHAILFEDPDGTRTYESGFRIPLLAEDERPWGAEDKLRHANEVRYHLELRPGTRRCRSASFQLAFPDGSVDELSFEPLLDFQMKGLGYLHPEWAHGRWHGGEVVGADVWTVPALDPLELPNVHVQQLCRVRRGDEEGIGTLEQLAIGPHAPTGLKDYFDGAAG